MKGQKMERIGGEKEEKREIVEKWKGEKQRSRGWIGEREEKLRGFRMERMNGGKERLRWKS